MSSVLIPRSCSTANSGSPKSSPTGPTTRVSARKEDASEQCTAEPPSSRSRLPYGVSTASKAIEPTTVSVMEARSVADRSYAPPMGDSHADRVERAFSRQAAAFEEQPIFTTDSDWLFERLELHAGDLVLDVAAGTGHVARALAPSVRCVVALDATAAVLAAGKAHADRAGLHNVVFQRGDAAALPFADATFDIVVSRFAVHHFEDPTPPLAEMRRCLRPGGRLAIADIIAADDPAVAALQNRLERLRDPSHAR